MRIYFSKQILLHQGNVNHQSHWKNCHPSVIDFDHFRSYVTKNEAANAKICSRCI